MNLKELFTKVISMLKKYISTKMKVSFWFLVCGILQKGIQIITTPIFTRIMSTSEYGDYSTYTAWYQIIYIFVTLKMTTGVYTQGLVKFEKERDDFSSSIFCLTSICILGSLIILFSSPTLWENCFDLSFILLIAILVDSLADSAFQLWQRRELVENRYKKLILISLLNSFFTPVLGIAAVMKSYQKVEARILTSVLINVILFFPLAVSILKKSTYKNIIRYWKYLLLYSIPLIPHYLAQVVLNQSDRIMIKKICNSADAGIYSLAYSLAVILQIINDAINKTLDPWLFKKIKEKQYNEIAHISYLLMIGVGIINLGLIAVTPEVIAIFAPKEYYNAIWVIPPVASSVFIIFMYNFFASFEFYYEKTSSISIASLIGAILNVILNAIFIPVLGFLAAGYTTLICYIFYIIFHYFSMYHICRDKLNVKEIYSIHTIIGICIIFGGCATIFVLLYQHFIIRYALILTIVLLVFLFRKKIYSIYKIKDILDRSSVNEFN